MNVFQKCLRRQMGNQVYHSFYKKCAEKFSQSNLSQLNTNDGHLHDALYECIKKDDFEGLEEKKRDISETLRTAVRITKYFGLVILAYLFGNIILLALNLDYYVTCVSILLMGICFIYKLIEYISNKYCVLDVYLFMLYRSVIDKRTNTECTDFLVEPKLIVKKV